MKKFSISSLLGLSPEKRSKQAISAFSNAKKALESVNLQITNRVSKREAKIAKLNLKTAQDNTLLRENLRIQNKIEDIIG